MNKNQEIIRFRHHLEHYLYALFSGQSPYKGQLSMQLQEGKITISSSAAEPASPTEPSALRILSAQLEALEIWSYRDAGQPNMLMMDTSEHNIAKYRALKEILSLPHPKVNGPFHHEKDNQIPRRNTGEQDDFRNK